MNKIAILQLKENSYKTSGKTYRVWYKTSSRENGHSDVLLLSSTSWSECSVQGQVLNCMRRNQGCSSAEGRSSTANSGAKVPVLLGMNRCVSFSFFSVHHSLFNIRTDLKRFEKIPGATTWRWGEWIWLNGPSGLHRNSPQGLNISSIMVFDQIRDPEIPVTLHHSPLL